jgi:hypothetical protein
MTTKEFRGWNHITDGKACDGLEVLIQTHGSNISDNHMTNVKQVTTRSFLLLECHPKVGAANK